MLPEQELHRSLCEIADQIRRQNNGETGGPIFFVQKRKWIYGVDPDYHENAVPFWADRDGDEVTEDMCKALSELWGRTANEPDGFTRAYKTYIWYNLQPYFSRRAANAHIEDMGDDYRLFIGSALLCHEWRTVRKFLMNFCDGQSSPMRGVWLKAEDVEVKSNLIYLLAFIGIKGVPKVKRGSWDSTNNCWRYFDNEGNQPICTPKYVMEIPRHPTLMK